MMVIPSRTPTRRFIEVGKTMRCALLTVFLMLMLSGAGHCSMSILPMEKQVKVAVPGSRITDEIEVFNQGDTAEHVSASIVDWTVTETGEKRFSGPGTQPRSCAQWIHLNPPQFILPPKKSMRVRYSISTPPNLAQEHWAMIFFTGRPLPVKGEAKVGLTIRTRIGCKLFVVPDKPLERQGKIMALDLAPDGASQAVMATTIGRTSEPAPTPVTTALKIAFENTSAINVRLKGVVEARSTDGRLLGKCALTPTDAQVLSGMTRVLTARFESPLPPGTCNIRVVIDCGATQLIVGETKTCIGAIPTSPSEN